MTRVTIEEAQSRLADLVSAAAAGEDVVIAGNGQPEVRLVPVAQSRRGRKAGSAKGLIVISDDFHEPIDDFHEYMPIAC